jgi:hypothetical protein
LGNGIERASSPARSPYHRYGDPQAKAAGFDSLMVKPLTEESLRALTD